VFTDILGSRHGEAENIVRDKVDAFAQDKAHLIAHRMGQGRAKRVAA
jgi:hypothetical protein